jgi:hypothetical protein
MNPHKSAQSNDPEAARRLHELADAISKVMGRASELSTRSSRSHEAGDTTLSSESLRSYFRVAAPANRQRYALVTS